MWYKNKIDNTQPCVYSSAGARVLDFFTKSKMFTEVWVTGFSFFDKATYFNPATNHNIREHCYFKEKCYYNMLIKNKKIYEL